METDGNMIGYQKEQRSEHHPALSTAFVSRPFKVDWAKVENCSIFILLGIWNSTQGPLDWREEGPSSASRRHLFQWSFCIFHSPELSPVETFKKSWNKKYDKDPGLLSSWDRVWDENGTTFLFKKSSRWSLLFPDVYWMLIFAARN